jgi:hypothetical protein
MVSVLTASIVLVGSHFAHAAGTTYTGVDLLPEPTLTINDRAMDAEYVMGSGPSVGGWSDIKQVQLFLTETGLAFAVFTGGRIPPPGQDALLILGLDIDGPGGSVGQGPLNGTRIPGAGYDFLIGSFFGELGVFRVTNSDFWPKVADIGHWREGDVAYFEVAWDDLGGAPSVEAIGFLVAAERSDPTRGSYQDRAPSRGSGLIEIPEALRAAEESEG